MVGRQVKGIKWTREGRCLIEFLPLLQNQHFQHNIKVDTSYVVGQDYHPEEHEQ